MSTHIQTRLSSSLVQIHTRTLPPVRVGRNEVGTARATIVNVEDLERDLRAAVGGEVRFGAGDRAMYASDAGNYRMVPIGVVVPADVADVERAVAVCRKYGAPIVARGGGTGIPGQTVNVAVVLDFSKYMNGILSLDPGTRTAGVEAGVVLDALRAAALPHGLTFGPDPSTHSRCTLGGMIGNNSCGIHSVMAGTTADNIDELDILTYDGTRMTVGATSEAQLVQIAREGGRRGEIYGGLDAFRRRHAEAIRRNFPSFPRRVSGYNLPALLPEHGFHVARALVGSEGTCVLVVGATTRLVDNPPVRSLLVLGYPDIFVAADHVTDPLPHGPLAIEAIDRTLIEAMKKKGMHPPRDVMPDGGGWLLVEFGGTNQHEADGHAGALMDALQRRGSPPSMALFDPKQAEVVWHLREEGLGATAHVPGEQDNHEGWEDSAVPPEKLGGYLRELQRLLDRYEYRGSLYGHFGQGCVHTRLTFELRTAAGIDRFRSFLGEAADLVVQHGGSLSGEHGDGQARGELLPRMFDDDAMHALREFKAIWDPEWKMNPGKLVVPYGAADNLRLGAAFNPWAPATRFQYPDDGGSFAEATERCVGAGVCRRLGGGTMCPSYMVTREERHSTRGRARLLNEMLRGDPISEGWRSEAVKEALDLCLACKGCKGDCPVQVDVATYKAEFLSHYYEGRLRPRSAYAFGLIFWWARLASWAPAVVNACTQTPVLRAVAKLAAGVAPARDIPRFAPATFKAWFRARPIRNQGRPQVMLWPDTFSNHFHPATAKAAVEVLEAAHHQVIVPRAALCCGRPLYDHGMLGLARRLLRDVLDALGPVIRARVPLVVLEPSCAAVFRDELRNWFPDDEDAKRLAAQTCTLAEFVNRHAPDLLVGRLQRQALLHGHCHQKAIMKLEADEAVLARLGLTLEIPDSGCCGMAGSFGFTKGDHYDISMQCGERVLLPAVRSAADGTLIVADGFSCREQIAQATGRHALHLAQVLQMALKDGKPTPLRYE